MPVTRRPRSSTFAARCCSAAACRRFTSASLPTRRRPKAESRTGASGSTMIRRSSSRSRARRAAVRPEAALRPCGPSRGRQLALPPAERDRRRRSWRDPRRSRRRPCLEQRVADADVRGARREAAEFAHEALLVAAEGKLSKRLGSYGAEHLREEGVEPMALLSVLARIGTSQPVEPRRRSMRSRRPSTSPTSAGRRPISIPTISS